MIPFYTKSNDLFHVFIPIILFHHEMEKSHDLGLNLKDRTVYPHPNLKIT